MLRQIPTILLPSSCSSSVSIKEILESLKRIASYFADGLKDDRLRFLLILRQSFAFVSNLQVGAHPSSIVLRKIMQIQPRALPRANQSRSDSPSKPTYELDSGSARHTHPNSSVSENKGNCISMVETI